MWRAPCCPGKCRNHCTSGWKRSRVSDQSFAYQVWQALIPNSGRHRWYVAIRLPRMKFQDRFDMRQSRKTATKMLACQNLQRSAVSSSVPFISATSDEVMHDHVNCPVVCIDSSCNPPLEADDTSWWFRTPVTAPVDVGSEKNPIIYRVLLQTSQVSCYGFRNHHQYQDISNCLSV